MTQAFALEEDNFLQISARTIFPETISMFDLYLRRDNRYILYTDKGEMFGEERLAEVLEVTHFYIPADQRAEYERYLAKNLGDFLDNESISIEKRTELLHNFSKTIINRAFDRKLPKPLNKDMHRDMMCIVSAGMKFMEKRNVLRTMSKFIAHDYHTYHHSLQLMVLYLTMMRSMFGMEKDVLLECGLGALLHDIGKSEVPEELLQKKGEFTRDEFDILKTHPAKGMHICSEMPLSKRTQNIILYHHECMDGSGYPAALKGNAIPLEARALSVCNIYDNLTVRRPGAQELSPFEALKMMKDEMEGVIDMDCYRQLVQILSKSKVV